MPRRRYDDDYNWPPYISAAERRSKAARETARLTKTGRSLQPVVIDGFKIAKTFWGKAWCGNLERYSDFANRLPRGRSYLRNGSVLDLRIANCAVTALVSGSRVYDVEVNIAAIPGARWKSICTDCAGAIDSLVELLKGRLSDSVMSRLCQEKTGMFPSPPEIKFQCSCPDSARMCKHVAAVLYGIGARLDEKPELLFTLRNVNQKDLIVRAGEGMVKTRDRIEKVLEDDNLSEIFGIEITQPPSPRGRKRRGKP
ncbi:MAG TPA: SWIM zinc finger family protein [Terriglobia bacterium]|nr:SWIM zinc finger family protein [Terriglobia bacterium]